MKRKSTLSHSRHLVFEFIDNEEVVCLDESVNITTDQDNELNDYWTQSSLLICFFKGIKYCFPKLSDWFFSYFKYLDDNFATSTTLHNMIR